MDNNFLYSFSSVSVLSMICLYITDNIFKMPPAIGFLIAGILSSESFLNIALVIKKGNMLGDFGLLFLMLYIGMEFSYSHLNKLKHYIKPSFIIYSASAAIIFMGFIGFLFYGWLPNLHNNFFPLISIILCFSMASTAVTIQLIEHNKNKYINYMVITSLILQDLIVILLMLITSNNIFQGSFFDITFKRIIVPLIITVAYIFLVENTLFKPLMKFLYNANNNHILPIFSIFLVVISSYLSAINGISQEFGVFIIGMLMGDTEYKYSILSDIKPFKDIFLGLFFLSIGATFNYKFFINNWVNLMIFFFVIFLLKFIGLLLGSYIITRKFFKSLMLSMKLSNFSEISFIILNNLKKNQYLNEFTVEFFLTVTIVSFVLSPVINKFTESLFKSYFSGLPADLKNQHYNLIIIGFSKLLLPVIKILEENHINYVIVEKNLSKISIAKGLNFNIMYGNMFNENILSTLEVQNNTTVFINFSIMQQHTENLINFRKKFHTTKLIALANLESESFIQRFNIEIVKHPYLEQSMQITKLLLYNFNPHWHDNDLNVYLNNFKNRWNDPQF